MPEALDLLDYWARNPPTNVGLNSILRAFGQPVGDGPSFKPSSQDDVARLNSQFT